MGDSSACSAEATALLPTELSLVLPNLAGLQAELADGWPVLARKIPTETGLLTGRLDATVKGAGALAGPATTLSARWQPGPGESLAVEAAGRRIPPYPETQEYVRRVLWYRGAYLREAAALPILSRR